MSKENNKLPKENLFIVLGLVLVLMITAAFYVRYTTVNNKSVSVSQQKQNNSGQQKITNVEPKLVSGVDVNYAKETGTSYSKEEITKINKRQVFKNELLGMSFEYPSTYKITKDNLNNASKNLFMIRKGAPISNVWKVVYTEDKNHKYPNAYIVEVDFTEGLVFEDQTSETYYDKLANAWIRRTPGSSKKVRTLKGTLSKAKKEATDVKQPDYELRLEYPQVVLGDSKQQTVYVYIKGCNAKKFENKKIAVVGVVKWDYSETVAITPRALVNPKTGELVMCSNFTESDIDNVFPVVKDQFVTIPLAYSQRGYDVLIYKSYYDKVLAVVVPTYDKASKMPELYAWTYFVSALEKSVKSTYDSANLKKFYEKDNPIVTFKYPNNFALKNGASRGSEQTKKDFLSLNIDGNYKDVIKYWKLTAKDYPGAYVFFVNNIRKMSFMDQVGAYKYSPTYKGWIRTAGGQMVEYLDPLISYKTHDKLYYFETAGSKYRTAFFVFDQGDTASTNGVIIAVPIVVNGKTYKQGRLLANSVYNSLIPLQDIWKKPFSYNTLGMKVEFKYPGTYTFKEIGVDVARKAITLEEKVLNHEDLAPYTKVWEITGPSGDHGYVIWTTKLLNLKATTPQYTVEYDKQAKKWVYAYKDGQKTTIYPLKNGMYVAVLNGNEKSYYLLWGQVGREGILIVLPYDWAMGKTTIVKTFKLWSLR